MDMVNKTHVVDTALVVTAGAYSNGDVVGGRINLKDLCGGGGGGTIRQVRLVDADAESAVFKLYFFDEQPPDIADNASFTGGISGATDLAKICGIVDIASGDWVTLDGDVIALKDDLVVTHGNGQLWAYLVLNGSTPTFAATTDLTLKITGWLD